MPRGAVNSAWYAPPVWYLGIIRSCQMSLRLARYTPCCAPGDHPSPSLKAFGFLTDCIVLRSIRKKVKIFDSRKGPVMALKTREQILPERYRFSPRCRRQKPSQQHLGSVFPCACRRSRSHPVQSLHIKEFRHPSHY
jgi:hypothetical protein